MVLVVDHGKAVNILIPGIELIAVDPKLHLRPLLLGEGQKLSKYRTHGRSTLWMLFAARQRSSIVLFTVKLFNDFTEDKHID
jgi:hypothetical protein